MMLFNGQTDSKFRTALRTVAIATASAMLWLSGPAAAFAKIPERPKPVSRLKAKGLTDTPDAALRAKIDAKAAASVAAAAKKIDADVRPLSDKQMRGITGRGHFRNPGFNGTLPWQRSFHDVNLCNGNLFKSFTDMQVAPGRGAGLVLQRTYNSNDDRVGPFGIGWTHAYDIRMEEAGVDPATDTEKVNRTDFFGGKHKYSRDADGLYTPPPYLYDELSSKYDEELANGPSAPTEDSQKGMDGTVKHFIDGGTNSDSSVNHNLRVCDTITDRHGNVTTLTYGSTVTMADGSTQKLLTKVTDPVGRSIVFSWTNLGTTLAPAYRITQVEGPFDPSGLAVSGVTYKVSYTYYLDVSHPESYLNLYTVTLDSEGLARTTTYTYTSVTGGYTDPATSTTTSDTENGLLASISDPLSHTVSYNYRLTSASSAYPDLDGGSDESERFPTGTVWVNGISEPASAGGSTATLYWEIGTSYYASEDFFYFWPDVGYPAEPNVDGNFLAFTTTVSCPNLQTTDSGDTIEGLAVSVGVDQKLRTASVYLDNTRIEDNLIGDYHYLISYDSSNNVLRKGLIDGSSHYYDPETDSAYNTGSGGTLDLINSSVMAYDAHGSVTSQYIYGYPGTASTSYYNASKYFQKSSATDALGHVTSMDYYDDNDASQGNWGEVKWVRDAGYAVSGSPSYGKEFDYTYNTYGQKATETNLAGTLTAYTYGDSYGNLTQVVQDPSTTTPAYIGLNRTTQMSYDLAGHVTHSVDPSGHVSTFAYNTLGQPTVAKFYSDAGVTLEEQVSYSYDSNGRTASVTDNRGTTSMTYETGCDRVASVSDPVTGTVSYAYNILGERTSLTLPSVGTFTYTYHTPYYAWDNRHGWTASSLSITGNKAILPSDDPNKIALSLMYITDPDGRRVDVQMNGMGAANLVNAAKSYDMSGNLYGQMVSHTQQEGYLASGDSPNHNQFDYFPYYTSHRLSRLSTYWNQPYKDSSGTTVTDHLLLHRNDYAYDNNSQRTSNAISHQDVNATTGLPNLDSSGAPVVITDREEDYTYDNLSRLATVNYGDGETQSYSFDAMGNRATKSDTTAGSGGVAASTVNESYAVDAANRLTSRTYDGDTSSVTSDANGNTLTDGDGNRTYTWDSENRLVSCKTRTNHGYTNSAYTYGSDGLRRQGIVSTYVRAGVHMSVPFYTATGSTKTKYVYDGSMMVEEIVQHFNGSGSALDSPMTITYFQGPQGPLYRKASTEADPHWYMYDGLGSVVGEIAVDGTVSATKKFDVYGLTRGYTGTPTTRQGFVGGLGHETDDETGLAYMRARYYDPSTGRFASQDPGLDGSNWYMYSDDNPINYRDFSGQASGSLAETEEASADATASEGSETITLYRGMTQKNLDAWVEKGLDSIGEDTHFTSIKQVGIEYGKIYRGGTGYVQLAREAFDDMVTSGLIRNAPTGGNVMIQCLLGPAAVAYMETLTIAVGVL